MYKLTAIISLIFILFFYKSYSQVILNRTDVLTERKFVRTYVALKGIKEDDSTAEQYRKLFQDYWKFTPEIVFIDPFVEIPPDPDPNGLYIYFKAVGSGYSNGNDKPYYSMVISSFYKDNIIFGHIRKEISLTLLEINKAPRKIFSIKAHWSPPGNEIRYDGEGLFNNWKPGYIKNHLQHLNNIFLNPPNKAQNLANPPFHINKEALKTIANDTLYFSYKINTEKYPYNKVVLTEEELNNKILNSEEPFYYVNTVYWLYEHITIFNAKTGNIVYYRYGSIDNWNHVGKLVKDMNKKEPFIQIGK